MSLTAFTPEVMSQFIQFAASQAGVSPMDYMRALEKGIKPVPRETKSVEEFQNVVIKVEDEDEAPMKTTKTGKVRKPHCKPTTNPNTLEVGAVEVDAEGRVHEVVQGQAFGKPCLKWKLVKVEKEQEKVEKEPIRGLVDYSDSEDEAETTEVPAEMPVKTKRAYRSSKPSVKPSEVGETSESGGKVWIVAEAKVRGDGRRLLWKILKDAENKDENDELDEQLAAEILANFTQHHDKQKAEWVPPENLPEAQWDITKAPAEKPKPTRKSPEISANSETVQVGDVQVGIDGKNYKCVELTRTSKKTGETTTFRRWQKMKA